MEKIPQSNRSFADKVIKQQRREHNRIYISALLMAVVLVAAGIAAICFYIQIGNRNNNGVETLQSGVTDNYRVEIDLNEIPNYTGSPYCEINNNYPFFELSEIDASTDFEIYSKLDRLGRCGTAYANLSNKMMPSEERGQIGIVKPSGWHTVKYPDVIEDLYLYNRCHLIAYSLSGENANELNLITGTRYLNIKGMLPFEIKVLQYIEDTGNHVLYRVTPIFNESELLARGVLLEAQSVEDEGEGICFNVFVYNVQPGINIDYSDGSSRTQEQ